MATLAESTRTPLDKERIFFLRMAIAMALILVAGFSTSLVFGRSSFSLPLIYHVHAFVFFGWIALFLLQNTLVATGSVALHQRMGVLALAWIPAMVVLGLMMTRVSLQTKGGPPFFDSNEFLFGNSIGVLTFAGVAFAGIALRGQTDWHRRFMCCAMASITGPGIGRILPMPFLIPWAWWIASVFVPLIFVAIGMVHDRRLSGKIHPAWFVCTAIFVGSQIVADLIAYSPIGYELTHRVVDGTPGGLRDMRAHFP